MSKEQTKPGTVNAVAFEHSAHELAIELLAVLDRFSKEKGIRYSYTLVMLLHFAICKINAASTIDTIKAIEELQAP